MPLGKEAVAAALADAGLAPDDVGMFAVVSCTGYATPGLDIRIAADLGMGLDVQRLLVGHMGCYAAIPGLGAAADFATSRGRPAVHSARPTSLRPPPAPGPTVTRPEMVTPGGCGGQAAQGTRRSEVVDIAALMDLSTADRHGRGTSPI
jgi:hypothetical protein